ncbi:MAG TPA: hypothetical protein VL442_10305 [Mucilaginibacter sp.]|nr:hypothetical protein [Mucilaginibacter sp.]
MKKLLLFSAFIIFVLASCSNSNKSTIAPTSASKFSATIDGVHQTFDSKDSVRLINTAGIYLSGTNDTTSNKILLYIISNTKLDTGTYVSTYPAAKSLQLFYGVGPGYTADNLYYTYDISQGASFDGTLTVTSLSSTSIKGTFSGKVVLESSILTTPQSKTITDGKFDLSIAQ